MVKFKALSGKLEGKKVRIIDIDGKVFEGVVGDYIAPEDNEPEGISAIDLEECQQCPGELVGFNEDEIQSIEVID